MEFLNLGKIVSTHGLDGTLVIASTSDFSNERYTKGQTIYLQNPYNKEILEFHVKSHRNNKQTDYVSFEELPSIEQAEKYKGFFVLINKDEAPIPEGYYRYSDLEECVVIDQHDKKIGKVIKVEEFPAQITLRVKSNEGKSFFVPFINDIFILNVDIENKTIKINFMEGML